jgi:hypothetical protein
LVNPGVGETRARPSLPARKFNNDDLPTFERPMKANSGRDSSGHASRSGALHSKMADEICMIKLDALSQQIRAADTTIFKARKPFMDFPAIMNHTGGVPACHAGSIND